MRYSTLVFAAILAVFAVFTAQAQQTRSEVGRGKAVQVHPTDRKGNSETPQAMGRITDFAGRSIKAADVTFFCVDCDEVVKVKSNAFGFYTASSLTEGRTYLISVQHRRYLFLGGSEMFTAGPETFELDFVGDPIR